MKTPTKLLCALALFTATHLPAQSVPEYLNYQGLLKAPNGSPLPTDNYTMEFNIFNSANGTHATNRVWGPFLFDGGVGNGHGLAVPVVNGSFNVIIGPNDTAGRSITNAFSAPNRFIEIKVNNGDPILPRQQFLSTAYAVQSQKAQLADVASMLVKELYDALCPPGTIVAFGGPNVPSGWLLCDGRPLTNAMLPNLFAAIGTSWGNGDLDSNGIAENPQNPDTGFNLPDLRGMFLRGVNGSRTGPFADPDSTSRSASATGGDIANTVGSVQTNQVKLHNHDNPAGGGYDRLMRMDNNGTATDVGDTTNPSGNEVNLLHSQPILSVGGSETRPNNAYVNYIIKY